MILHLVIEGLWNIQDISAGSVGNRELWQLRDQQLMICSWL